VARVDRKALIEWLEPEVNSLGYELLDIEWITGRGAILRLFIDGEAGIGLGDCETVSRAVEALLDVRDVIPGSYQLEVSSPGPERPLRTRAHFEAAQGERIRLQLLEEGGAVRKFRGTLVGVEDNALRVENEEGQRVVLMDDILAARLVPAGDEKAVSGKKRRRKGH